MSNFLRHLFSLHTETLIVTYKGYGRPDGVYIKGSVLRNRPTLSAAAGDGRFKNFRNMIARYLSSPQAGQTVEVCLGVVTKTVKTDSKGYFEAWLEPEEELAPGWQAAICRLLQTGEGEDIHAPAPFLVTSDETARFGVISDIDDTVLVSHATRLFRKLWLVLTKNSRTRLPFAGVADFYEALRGDATHANPFFYVSSSEWNLYDFLDDFFAANHLPKGPFLLQQLKKGLKELIFTGGGDHSHKEEKIRRLMELYPAMPFVLIGDSGQRDMSIYASVVRDFPGRVEAVYIRQISEKHVVPETEQAIFDAAGVEVLLAADTLAVQEHARRIGLLSKPLAQNV